MRLNGNKTNLGLIVAGLGALMGVWNLPYSDQLMTWGLAFAGVVGAGHRVIKNS